MPEAVGVIETLGFPAILAAADAMVKAARVTVVWCDKAESGRFVVAIRGPVSEVKTAHPAGIAAAENVYGGEVLTHYIVPNPPENVVSILPIDYSEAVEPFR
ncbi:BMC domain-containing protein [Spirulina major CS-329]|uniref:BMC domain-containing protein n=1 Tax=Spirulina TaxID=1154 RepID=UPI00232AABC6|nr:MULTISPECIES: BMC domain-containing protein [Spirulina]MDB9493748.1 BMC domain-containing protein [Spirulina subsalsa CS-330]MDB9501966.1 BMC domain-containing protein [Spirulina major CS-329]